MTNSRLRLLVLCTGNSCRSQMAEAFLRRALIDAKKISNDNQVCSAGIEAHGLNPRAVAVMREAGIDISGHTSQTLDQFSGIDFDYVITVCDNAAKNCPVYPSQTMRLHWPFDDPAGVAGVTGVTGVAGVTGDEDIVMNKFRRVRDEIRTKVDNWVRSELA